MDLSKVDKKALVGDLVKVATFNIVAHALMSYKYGDELFNEKFVYSLIFILIGFAIYHVVLDKHVISYFKSNEKFVSPYRLSTVCAPLSKNNANCKWELGEYICDLSKEYDTKTIWTRRMNTGEPNDPLKWQLEFATGSKMTNMAGSQKNPITVIYKTFSLDEKDCCKLNIDDIRYLLDGNKMYKLKLIYSGNKKCSWQKMGSYNITSDWTERTKSNF